jgi:hypothetical protein
MPLGHERAFLNTREIMSFLENMENMFGLCMMMKKKS